MSKHFFIEGAKGSSQPQSSGVESANTLRSLAIANITELISEGECVGLVDDEFQPVTEDTILTSIFLNKTPIKNTDNSLNFQGVSVTQRFGLPDQDPISGVAGSETNVAVEVQVKQSLAAPVRTISDLNADAAKVVVRIPALASQNSSSGDVTGTDVSYAIDLRANGGAWTQVHLTEIVNQKCTSPYQRQHLIELPTGGAPWDLRVRRLTADSTEVKLQNDTYWESYAILTRGKFIYPNSALVSFNIDSRQFGSSVPARAYRYRGLIIDVPSNYDPETRTYDGIWDGTWKKGWTNNPAYIFRDLLLNNRYGLGEFVDLSIVDKFTIYRIGQYCDELVPSGFKDENGDEILEPRFTFNTQIITREDAYRVLQNITTAFRGMAYWSLGQVFATADIPEDPATVISPSNVVNGRFHYSKTALKARHSVAMVSWNDPADFYAPAVEVVQNQNQLARYGWNSIEAQHHGCTSRGQANRFGRWILDAEEHETETVTFDMSFDGHVLEDGQALRPGQIILVNDPHKAGGVRAGGRLVAVNSLTQLKLDAPFAPTIGVTYNVTVVMEDGSLEKRTINSFASGNTIVNLATALPSLPKRGTQFAIQGVDLQGKLYRVLSVREDKQIFSVTALFHDPTKYARVEQGLILDAPTYTRPSNIIRPPTNPHAVESRYFQNGVTHSRVSLSWTSVNDFLALDFKVTADSPRGFVTFAPTNTPSIDIVDPVAGEWTFYIQSVNRAGNVSPPLEYGFTVQGWEAIEVPVVDMLELQGGGTTFEGTAPTLVWENVFPTDAVVYQPENVVRVYDAADHLLRTEIVRQPSYTYDFEKNVNDGGPRRALRFDVTVKGVTGIESDPATISVDNPVPALVTPSIKPGVNTLEISYTPPTDNDFAGVMIWCKSTGGFNPSLIAPDYDGPDTTAVLTLDAGTYYVRVAVYDRFGKQGLNVSSEISVTVTSVSQAIAAVLPSIIETNGAASLLDVEDLAEAVALMSAQMVQDRDDEDGRLQRIHNMLSVQLDNVQARFVQEQYARVEADLAEARARELLSAQIGDGVLAAIANEQTARVTADNALATNISSITTSLNGHTSQINTIQGSYDGVKVQFGVTGTIDNTTGGFLFEGIRKLDGTVSYTLKINADVIVDGSITTDKLAANVITADKLAANVADFVNANINTAYITNLNASNINSNFAIYNKASVLPAPVDKTLITWGANPVGPAVSMTNDVVSSVSYQSNKSSVLIFASVVMGLGTDDGISGSGQSFSVSLQVLNQLGTVIATTTLRSTLTGANAIPTALNGQLYSVSGLMVQVPVGETITVRVVTTIVHGGFGGMSVPYTYTWKFNQANILFLEPRGL
jgi:predicted phage tail protein